MGYQVKSIFSVSPNDQHSYFLYFIPGDRFSFEWIDNWVMDKIMKIADNIGPNGVIIGPLPSRGDEYLESLTGISGGGCFFSSAVRGYGGTRFEKSALDILHCHYPFVIISKTPLIRENESNNGLVINLAGCRDESHLRAVFDVIIHAILSDDIEHLKKLSELPEIRPEVHHRNYGGWSFAFDKVEEIKPNLLYKTGKNLDFVLSKISELVLKKKYNKKEDNRRKYNWDFFIAHSSRNKNEAINLYELLSNDYRVFLDSKCLLLGDEWDREIAKAQKNSFVSLILISENTDSSYYEREEIAASIALARKNENGHRVIPIYLEGFNRENDSIPYGLRLKQGMYLSKEFNMKNAVNKLIKSWNQFIE